ncbi:ABC transporter permease, partial [Acinetobacter baumannii]
FASSFSSMLGLVLVILFLFLAAFGPWLAPYPEHTTGGFNMAERLQPPSAEHWFGTDEMGSDILSRVIVGARTSLWIGVLITGI